MKSIWRRNLLLLVLAGTIPIAYYAGGVSGFAKGYSAALFAQSGSAGPTVLVLRNLRTGDTASAINILESDLDSLLILNKVGRDSYRSSFNLAALMGVGSATSIDTAASPALAYRSEFPSRLQPPEKAAIDGALDQLANHIHETE